MGSLARDNQPTSLPLPPRPCSVRKLTYIYLLRITYNYTCILHAYNCNGPVRQPSPEVVGQHIHSVPAGSPPGGKVASVAYPPGGPSLGWDATPCGTSPGPRRLNAVRAARGSGTLRFMGACKFRWVGGPWQRSVVWTACEGKATACPC